MMVRLRLRLNLSRVNADGMITRTNEIFLLTSHSNNKLKPFHQAGNREVLIGRR